MSNTIVVDNYHLIEIIGEGKASKVYIGIDDKNNQIVAVKRLPKKSLNERLIKNLRRELNILHKLENPKIISLKNFKKTANNLYIILEYCNGGDLDTYSKNYISKNKRPLNEFYIQKIIQQIAPAIEYMHSNNIIHRDIKLENILINFDNYPNILKSGKLPPKLKFEDMSLNKSFTLKISDLGYAKDYVNDIEGSTLMGNPKYISPDILEQKGDIKKYNTSTDLWSLGVITYELLTGTTLFIGNTPDEIIQNIKNKIYNIPKKLRTSVEIISFINGLLQYNPEKRLNWEQINSHPFLTKNVNDFTFIDLEMTTEEEQNVKGKDIGNLLWFFFKNKNLNINIDKLNQKEAKKPEIKKEIDKNKVINEEVKTALEKERIESEKEKQKIKDMKAQAEQEKKKAEQIIINKKKEQEKLVNEEKNIKNIKDKLIKENKQDNKNTEEISEKLNELQLKLEQIKNDKDNINYQLKNAELEISDAENIKIFTEKQINKINNENDDKNELNKLIEDKNKMEKEMQKLKEEQKKQEENYKKEKDELNQKLQKILEQKKLLENKIHEDNNEKEKDKYIDNDNDNDTQMENLKIEIQKIDENKNKQIKNILKKSLNIENQIKEFEQKIKEKEEKEKEKEKENEKEEKEIKDNEKKGIFESVIEIKKEDINKEMLDEWEDIDEDEINSIEEFSDIDFEDNLDEGYEIVYDYVDNEINKNNN